MGIVSRDSFACLKTENILLTMGLYMVGYLCVLLIWRSASLSVIVLTVFSLDVSSQVGSSVSTSVTSMVSIL